MSLERIRTSIAAIVLAAATATGAQESLQNRAVLFDASTASNWSCDEATMETSPLDEGSVLHWRVNVDYNAGEARYPIGWPRAVGDIPEVSQNWQEWDFLEFRMKVQSSRAPLPPEPAGLLFFNAEGQRTHTYPLTDAKLNEWVPFKIPVADLPSSESVGRIQFYISESNYAHGDSLSFLIDQISLVRHSSPTLIDVVPEAGVVFHDVEQLSVRLRVSGLDTHEKAEVFCAIMQGPKAIAVARVSLQRGWNDVDILLPDGLTPGDYAIRASITGSAAKWEFPLRAIESPWR